MKYFILLFFCTTVFRVYAQVRDSSFGIPESLGLGGTITGITACDFDNGYDQAFLAVHLNDGRIILVGDSRRQGESDFAFARLMADGQYDLSAGIGGQVLIDLGYLNDSCLAAARYQEDRIIMAGCLKQPNTGGYVNLIARIDFDGNLDVSFGGNGHLIINLPTEHEMITKIVPLPDGKFLIGGNALYGDSFLFPDSVDIFVGQLLPNGQIDSTFGENGFFYHRWERSCNVALLGDLSVDSHGKIIFTGGSYDPYPYNYDGNDWCYHNIYLCRYLPDGTPDPDFGSNGSLQLEYTDNGRGNALMLYEDGRILLAGGAGNQLSTFPSSVFLARIMPDGTPDVSFGNNGEFKHPILFGGSISGGLIEPKGLLRMRNRILVFGIFEINADPLGFGALCLTESGYIDTLFGDDGKFNAFPDLPFPKAYMNQISSSSNNNFFFSGYTRLLQPNNMTIVKIKWNETTITFDPSALNILNIYPNPASETVWIEASGHSMAIVEVYDISGRLLRTVTMPANITDTRRAAVDTSDLPTGPYLLRVQLGNGVVLNRKLVVMR